MISTKQLGKKLKVGDTFFTVTKRMIKQRRLESGGGPYLKILKPGHKQFFIKGKRRYYCIVIGITETRTGIYTVDRKVEIINGKPLKGWNNSRRWWQFTYLVKILEN